MKLNRIDKRDKLIEQMIDALRYASYLGFIYDEKNGSKEKLEKQIHKKIDEACKAYKLWKKNHKS